MTFCIRCGRELKNPESIKASMGPVCLAKVRITTARQIPYPKLFEEEDEDDNQSRDRELQEPQKDST